MSYNAPTYMKQGGIMTTGRQAAVTQGTNISTAVTCNSLTGVITTVSMTVAANAEAEFTVNNSLVAATDVIAVCIKTHTSAGTFMAGVSAVANGSFQIRLTNTSATTPANNSIVLNFVVLKCEA